MQFEAMRDMYIKNGKGFVLVYSVTSRLTFNDLKEHRDHVIKIKDTDNVSIIIKNHSAMHDFISYLFL